MVGVATLLCLLGLCLHFIACAHPPLTHTHTQVRDMTADVVTQGEDLLFASDVFQIAEDKLLFVR